MVLTILCDIQYNVGMNETELSELKNTVMQEIRRGILVLAALSELSDEKYGYSLVNSLAEKGVEIDQGTLYPLLRRLEAQGLLNSAWNVEGARPRRYYSLNESGKQLLTMLVAEWNSLTGVMEKLLGQNRPAKEE
jgi:PadR family transcriptional regulator PadR